ncbi:AAA family ATPase [Pontibacter sp. G13]|uniref:ATP-dependent DNA helicase n=1 Tax=Pontibacter sp. G13 TaxID=3074898 RepID=UPI0028899015|nr:AAA family ATPase [Pontibacter sp. G13]WNJ17801.1 AAA family ATPase [Pontibacter sp. G13]
MLDDILNRWLRNQLGEDFSFTSGQEEALRMFDQFIRSQGDRPTLLLTGSAGTGKTFLINIFTRLIKQSGYKVVLLAPTGRAAKVITKRSKRLAFTIHHHIYSPMEGYDGGITFQTKENKEPRQVVYIIDEASMIGGDEGGGNNLLMDVLRYVFGSGNGHRLILVGDPVQLPPVGHNDSPGLNAGTLVNMAGLDIFHAHLSEVKRQEIDSGVLEGAVTIRDAYLEQNPGELHLSPNREVQVLDNPWEALETYLGYYDPGNLDRVIFLTYSNFQATKVNQAIRKSLWETEEMVIEGDLLMVVRNNYTWGDSKKIPFLANGEMGTVVHVNRDSYEQKYGLQWMDVEIEFEDRQGEALIIECKIVLDLLTNKAAQLTNEQMHHIRMLRAQEYVGLSKSQAMQLMRTDPYANALQVKYGYAVTGHKAQGGQWENVIVIFEPDYGNDPLAYVRWSYTVFTRAEERVFMLNCPFVDAW